MALHSNGFLARDHCAKRENPPLSLQSLAFLILYCINKAAESKRSFTAFGEDGVGKDGGGRDAAVNAVLRISNANVIKEKRDVFLSSD